MSFVKIEVKYLWDLYLVHNSFNILTDDTFLYSSEALIIFNVIPLRTYCSISEKSWLRFVSNDKDL